MASPLSSIRQQLSMSFLLVALLPLIVVVLGMQWHFERELVRTKEVQLYEMARERGRLIREQIRSVKALVEEAANLAAMKSYLEDDHNESLAQVMGDFAARMVALNDYIYDVLLVNAQGKVIFTLLGESDAQADLTSARWKREPSGVAFDQVRMMTTTLVTPYRRYAPSNDLAAFVATPVLNTKGALRGVLLVQLRSDWLHHVMVSHGGLSRTGEAMLVRRNVQHKIVVASPLRFSTQADREGLVLTGNSSLEAGLALGGQEGWGEGVDYRNQRVLAGWVSIPMLDMGLVLKQDKNEVLLPAYQERLFVLVIASLVLLLVTFIVLLLAKDLAFPIQQMAEIMRGLRAGRWDLRVPEVANTSRELALLSEGVNQMADKVEQQLEQLQEQATELEYQASELEQHNEDLEHLVAERTKELERVSLIDPMTNLFNRRHFLNEGPKLWRQGMRNRQMLAFLLLDVDKFKEYNDYQGHQAGDQALIRVSELLLNQCRGSDLALRMGGEEMAILSLVHNEAEALALAHRVLKNIEQAAMPHPTSGVFPVLTVSVGVSLCLCSTCGAHDKVDIDRLYGLADKALYQAKENGRNQVALASEKVSC